MNKEKNNIILKLKQNSSSTLKECLLCKGEMKNPIPLGIFDEKTKHPICTKCAKEKNPDVYSAFTIFYRTDKKDSYLK